MIVSRSALALLLLGVFNALLRADPPAQDNTPISYDRQVRPLFQLHCQGCHQPAKAQGDYVMTSHAAMVKAGSSGEIAIVPGKPEESNLVRQLKPADGKKAAMPKKGDPLPDKDVQLIAKWIAQGAKDDTPASTRLVIDAEHPPRYALPPVVTSLDYSPDGQLLAVAGYHETLLHRADGQKLVARLVGLSERIESVAFSPDGKWLAVSGGDPGRFGEIQVWDVAKHALKMSVPMTYDVVFGASWSHDGSKIAFGCADKTLRAIDAQSGKQVLFQGAHDDWVLDTVFSIDASHLVSVSRDRSMKLTEVATQRFVDNITSITPGALKGGLMTVSRHPKKDELLIGGSDGTPKIYKMYRDKKRVIGDDFNLIRSFESLPGRIFTGRFSPDGTHIAVGSSLEGKGEARIYQVADGKLVAKLEGERGAIFCLAFSPNGKQIASAGFDGMVRLNDASTGKVIREFLPIPVQPAQRAASAR